MPILSLILFQIFVFIGLIYVFRGILTKNVTSATRHLEGLNQNYARREEEINRQVEKVKRESEALLSTASGEAENQKARIIREAETERDEVLKQAHIKSKEIIQQADNTREMLIAELDEKIAKAAIDKACELIQNTLPAQFKQDAHSQWVQELIKNGFSRLERLRIPADIREIKLTSAFPLNNEQRRDLSKRLKELLGHEPAMREEIDSGIVVGIIVAIGSLVLDGSLRNKIQEQAKECSLRD